MAAKEERRAMVHELLLENARLRQERGRAVEPKTPARPRQHVSITERALSFTPASSRPTPFHEDRPDYYAQSISAHERQHLSKLVQRLHQISLSRDF